VQQATRTAQDKAKEKAPVVGEMLTSKVKGSSEESTPPPVIVDARAVDATDRSWIRCRQPPHLEQPR
jgi:hypothetical protein